MFTTIVLTAALSLPVAAPLPPLSRSVKIATSVFAVSATADWTSTYIALNQHPEGWEIHEANPTLTWSDDTPALTVAIGATMDVVGTWAWNRYMSRKHPRIGAIGLYIASAFRVYLVISNARVIERAKRGKF